MRGLRIVLLIAGLGIAVCLCGSFAGVLVVGSGAPNARLNPFEGFAYRVMLWSQAEQLRTPVGVDPTAVRFTIQPGDTANTIAANLAAQGLIKDADLFRAYVRYNGIDANLQAGTYLLQQSQSIPEIAQALTNAGANTVRLLVKEGWRAEQIAQAIDATAALDFSGADFLALVRKGAALPPAFAASVGLPVGAGLEGFLFPATYELPLDATAADLRDRMLMKFNDEIDQATRDAIARQGLSLYEAVALASIVEREAVIADERPLIAGVYLNRLRLPMTLDADPTIQYALGNTRTPGTWWPNLTQADYRSVISPYNTYLNKGLPPSPIANPGQPSIQAIANPTATPFFFFRASCAHDGRHRFAVTFQEQLANAC